MPQNKLKKKKSTYRPSKHKLTLIKVSLNKVLMSKCSIQSQLISARCVIQLFYAFFPFLKQKSFKHLERVV